MAFNQVDFLIAKASDSHLIESLQRCLSEAGYSWQRAEFTPLVGGNAITVNPDTIAKDGSLRRDAQLRADTFWKSHVPC